MRTPLPLSILLFTASIGTTTGQITHDLVASDFQFDPLVLSISSGDTVHLVLGPGHSFREVSQNTWELNVAAPAIGLEFEQTSGLTEHNFWLNQPDTMYYVCVQHIGMGMKGRIIINEGTIGVNEEARMSLRMYPNPASDNVRVLGDAQGPIRVRVRDTMGRSVLEVYNYNVNGPIDVRKLPSGLFMVEMLDPRGGLLSSGPLMVER